MPRVRPRPSAELMPLVKSKSERAFHANIRDMVKAGHPIKQALAAAYATKREAEHKAAKK